MSLIITELWCAFKDNQFKLALVLFFCCGVLSVFYGKTQVDRQTAVMDQLGRWVRESNEAYFEERFKDDENIGRAHYYLSQATAHRPLPQAALSLGQRDVHSYHHSFRLRSLYTNLFDGGFENPSRAAAGHFDLAFVLVFLLPLTIIASTYDLFAREQESKTLTLLRSSGTPLGSILAAKFGARWLVTALLLTVLISLGFVAAGAAPAHLVSWLLVGLLYQCFWFGVAALVVGRAWGSSRAAGTLLGLWTLLAIVFPTLLNLLLPREATQNGASLAIVCRQVINEGWDIEKSVTLERASRLDSRYEQAPIDSDKFTWSWYYAMHDAGDQVVEQSANEYFEGLQAKDQKAFRYSILAAPVRAQLLFDRLAATDLATHLEYYRFVKSSREQMRQRSLPRVFQEEKLSKQELLSLHDDLPVLQFHPPSPRGLGRGLAEFFALTLLVVVLGAWSIRRIEHALRGSES